MIGPDSADVMHALYFSMYKRLLTRWRINKTAKIVTNTQARTTTGRDEMFWEFLRTEMSVSDLHRVRAKKTII
jgi:hypothetical protein